jgi:hypothetical protein
MAFMNTSFPSSLGAVLEALKGDISKAKSDYQSHHNHDKRLVFFINQQISIMVPEKMVYGSPEKRKEAGPPRCPVIHGELPSGPRRITQRSIANLVTERSAAAAPAAADDEGMI